MNKKNDRTHNYWPTNRREDDEINLLELSVILWKKKYWVLISTVIFSFVATLYTIIAPEQWTAHTTIYNPKPQETLKLDRLRTELNLQGLEGTKDNGSIYNDFLLEFKSYNNISEYLKTTTQFKDFVAKNDLDNLGQQRILRLWSEWMSVNAEDKKGEKPGVHLAFSFFDKNDSLSMLTGYINYIIRLQSQEQLNILESNRQSQINIINLKIKLKTEDAQRNLAREIASIEYSMSIAKAAGVNKPLENFTYGDRFPITLGQDGLSRKLNILKSIKIEEYQPDLTELSVQLAQLKSINLGDLTLSPFSYLDLPSEPLSRDKPKRTLIVILATFLGGMFGITLVLLQHALTQSRIKVKSGNQFQGTWLTNAN